jgi:hypothetical protein
MTKINKIIFASLVFLSLVASYNVSYAQDPKEVPSTGFKASYMGSVIYPGLKLGVERPIKVIHLEKEKRKGLKVLSKEKYLTLNLGFYHHPTFHDNFYMLAEYQMRRQKSSAWFREFSPGLGYSRTFLDGSSYNVSDMGEVTKSNAAGYTYAILSLAGGFGYDFSKKSDTPLKAFIKPSLLLMAPYNSFVYARPTVELGVVYSAGNFWKANPTTKLKKK